MAGPSMDTRPAGSAERVHNIFNDDFAEGTFRYASYSNKLR